MKKHYFAYPFLLLVGVFLCIAFSIRVSLPSEKNPQILYPSPERTNLRSLYAQAIKSAQHSLFLSTYTLSDPVIIRLLNTKADRGVRIRIMTDRKANKGLQKKLSKKISLTLEKGKGLMHEKILIIDETLLLLGTANMTHSSLLIHDNLVVGLYDPTLAHTFLESPGNRARTIQGTQGVLYLLPDPSGSLLTSIQNTLSQAKKTVDIALFTFTHPSLNKTLTSLSNRSIEVTCALDKNALHGATTPLFKELKENGAHLLLSNQRRLLHHKWALIDQELLLIGSANWTNSAFIKNKDFIIVIKLNDSNKRIIKNYWNRIVNKCNSY